MKNKKALLALVLALVLIVGAGIGGTVAWLVATSNSVTNTFTYGDINIKLEEHENGIDGKVTETGINNIKLIPGVTVPKDPCVTVQAGSEKCYLFVKVTEKDWPEKATYAVNAGTDPATAWVKYETTPSVAGETVYYREVEASNAAQQFYVLTGNANNGEVKFADTATKADIKGNPTLTFTAYAVQYEGMTDVNAAWNAITPAP